MFKIQETREAKLDVKKLAAYMIYSLRNGQAASDFLDYYSKQTQNLATFPFGYRKTGNPFYIMKINIVSKTIHH